MSARWVADHLAGRLRGGERGVQGVLGRREAVPDVRGGQDTPPQHRCRDRVHCDAELKRVSTRDMYL